MIYQWHVGDGGQVGKITEANDTTPASIGRSDFSAVDDIAYAPDGVLIACGTSSGYVYLWRASG